MIKTGFETRVKVQQIIENQLPEFLRSESPKAIDFLKQYYISQEYQGGPVDIADNLDQYLKIDNLTPEVLSGSTDITSNISSSVDTIQVSSTKGFPSQYGLLQIDDEIITYTGITTNSFTGCVRGFSAITDYRSSSNPEELVFSTSSAASHTSGSSVKNLSVEFLKEFYKKLKYSFTPGLENVDFVSDLDVNNFIKESRSLYESKGTEESFKILFKVLYGITPTVVDLENYLPKPSSARFLRREIAVVEAISGDPLKLVGQTIRKSTDSETQASISEVEIFTRSGLNKTYYKISLFVGYDDNNSIQGTFAPQPKVLAINPVSVGSSVITVDSTIGFADSGTLISGDNTLTYTGKTINQFLGCSGITSIINATDEIRSDEFYYGYENGDVTKKVEVRLTGVLSEFNLISDIKLASEGQKVFVNNVGEKILNPDQSKTHKEIFANSWIYNTSVRFEVDSISGSNFVLKGIPDKSNLKVGDHVDILLGSTENIVYSNAVVSSIFENQVSLGSLTGFVYDSTLDYSIRRNLKKAKSSSIPILYGNDVVTSDVQNLYNEKDEYFYVASNSLPSYTITTATNKAVMSSGDISLFDGYNSDTNNYSILSFPSSVPFVNGDEIYYIPENDPITGLEEGSYFVKVLSPSNRIKLYLSRSLIISDTAVEFSPITTSGNHTFILYSQKDQYIYPQRILKKFPSNRTIKLGKNIRTIPGTVGTLVNGVDILNYKSQDKIYYGPLDEVKIYNGGEDYDVINPPSVVVSNPTSGTTSLVRPVLKGSLKEVIVDPQNFDIKRILSIKLTGGNGIGARFEPVLQRRRRDFEFDARPHYAGGGINIYTDTIKFLDNHNLVSGEPLIYDNNSNDSVGIGTYLGSNLNLGTTLKKDTLYYPEVVNATTVKLYATLSDYTAGINTVGFTTSSAQGIHRLRTYDIKNSLKSIKIIDPGSGYQNRKLIVKPENVSYIEDKINFKNHGFNDGDLVVYTTDGTEIAGLSTALDYYVIKEDANNFRLADAGIGGTITSNYTRKNYVDLSSSGTGYQNFSYKPITLTVDVEYDGVVGVLTATPIIRGSITDLYLYEKGTGYGSNVLNFDKKPSVSFNSGKNAELNAIVIGGKIDKVLVSNSGSEYTSAPDLEVSGSGIGAKLRAVVSDGKITNVIIVNQGINYGNDTVIKVIPNGKNAFAIPTIRSLTVNNVSRFNTNEIIIDNVSNEEGQGYALCGYTTSIVSDFNDNGSTHSPIIGWAIDGNPIYGPYGYSDPDNYSSKIKVIRPGYVLSPSSVIDRPLGFTNGFFIEDYVYNNSGDLDQYNGRYCKTPEFPNGVYAYFAGISSTTFNSQFPYFIGDSYKALPVTQELNQDFDFNNSNLIRNTFPYGVAERYSNNDFIIEPYEIKEQTLVIDSVTKGSVTKLTINEEGSDYAVGDSLVFDNTDTNGSGLTADVKSVLGKTITDITTTTETHQSAKVVWRDQNTVSLHIDPSNNIINNDSVVVSGLSTFIDGLSKSHIAGISSAKVYLLKEVSSNATAGVVTDIYVSSIPVTVSTGSTIAIGTERMSVLNVFESEKVIRTVRGTVGSAHTASTEVTVYDGKITLPVSVPYFESRLNDKVYFNPSQSLGIGTQTGISSSYNYVIGDRTLSISVPNQSIYLPNHPFKTSQAVTLEIVSGINTISVSNTETSSIFTIPSNGTSQTLYVINKSKDYIGLTTQVGLTTNTDGLYFRSFVSNGSDEDYKYSLESNYTQVTGKVEKLQSVVSVSTSHLLNTGDVINLKVNSNRSIGVGDSTAIYVKYNADYNKLLINPIGFTSSDISTTSNIITLSNHKLKTGDKVFYSSVGDVASGLTTGSYHVYRIDDNQIRLGKTLIDVKQYPLSLISIGSTGGSSQEISLINPRISVIRNNDLVFDLSNSSLNGYDFKIFEDSDFYNKLDSTGSSSTFNVIGVGTVGVSTNASLTLNYSEYLPEKLYYALENGGYISTADKDIPNNNEILFENSVYDGSYVISGVGTTTFTISLKSLPETLNYTQDNTDVLKYSTSSASARGGVSEIKIIDRGLNYKKLPKFVSIASTQGTGVDITPESTNIGRINEVTILDQGFDFSSDKTLNPQAYVSPRISISNRDYVVDIQITSGGSNYTSAPDLVVVNPETGEAYQSGILEASIQGSSISSVNIVEPATGLANIVNKVFATNNTNGIGINSCLSSSSGVVTCILNTPILGFSTNAFNVGDRVFVENIQKLGSSGDGFNSPDLGYKFFDVTAYRNTNPAEVEFNISEYTSNPGIALTSQTTSFASIIKESNYPTFNVIQDSQEFNIGEFLFVQKNGSYIETDLIITESINNQIKVYGSYQLTKNEVVIGKDSGTKATISSIEENKASFTIDYSLRKDIGWSDDVGKLNLDTQVLPDNDYYQNLSYTIKSPITYDEQINPVNRLLHTSGLKNFADTAIIQSVKAGIGTGIQASAVAVVDVSSERRVDTINAFDLTVDIDVVGPKSKFLQFENKKLTDYIDCVTNKVLILDNVNYEFSSNDSTNDLYTDVHEYDIESKYNRFLVQVINPNNNERQSTEIITLPTATGNVITVQKGSVYSTANEICDLVANISLADELSLRFTPEEKYDFDYDIKVIKNSFTSSLSGSTGSESVGFVNLTGSNVSVGIGSTQPIISVASASNEGLFLNVEVENTSNDSINYVELYVDHNGTDTFISELSFNNDDSSISAGNFIGSFGANIDSGILSINYTNNESSDVFLRSKIVGFGATSSGIGTYRFLSQDQPSGSENTARLQSNFINSSGVSTVFTVSSSDVTTIKSVAKVGYGNTSALHQFIVIHDETNSHIVQYPFMSNGSKTGIGTFGSNLNGTDLSIEFFPDAGITDSITIQTYSEIIQTETDIVNIPKPLTYGSVTENLLTAFYNAINGDRVNKTSFEAKTSGIPVFEKSFDPDGALNLATGTFTVNNHFFSTGEELIYESGSSFTGIAYSDIQVSGAGNLPSNVFAIKLNDNQFQLATTRSDANSGTGITFSSYGSGNAHTLEMFKKMEKSIITIDGIVQSPIAYTNVSYTLQDNGGTVGSAATYFAVSGISSIIPGDILKIDDEYIEVESVGLGTTSLGPITGSGSFNIIKAGRGFVGSSATTHTDGTEARIYLGSFNIVDNKIHFTDPPRGNSSEIRDDGNLLYERSDFSGRVYLRQDYETNKIYDNISKSFTGIGQTYQLTVGGANTTGIETGSGVLFINNIFQTPTTQNNSGNNYDYAENSGITSAIFTGISTSGGILISDYDVNQNQLPRGGIIVSLGSTPGLGYAPLVGASVTAVVGAGGSIVSVGLGTTDRVGSGYNGIVSIGVSVFESGHIGDVASITANVGAGGTLSFVVGSGGTGYTSPSILVSPPSYENLQITGVSRLGVGSTTDTGTGLLLSVDVGSSSTTGIGSTMYEVKNFKITRPGYGFQVGDVFKPVGLVTDKNLSSPVEDFELTVLDTFTDSFSSWQFGELDFIDSIKDLQDGLRVRFPLYYNSQLLSFETSQPGFDMNSVLLIFINGVIQEPGEAYTFSGGTSFRFTEAPTDEDIVDIFFYRGTRGVDSKLENVIETIKIGDSVQVRRNNNIPNTIEQENRLVIGISSSSVETNLYSGAGIDDVNYKPTDWIKQKKDYIIGQEIVTKSRDSIELQVYPTAKVIGDLTTSDTEIFVDDAQFFNYEENESAITILNVDGIIIQEQDLIPANISANVSSGGTISSLTINDGGSGYSSGSVSISIAPPKHIYVGLGTTSGLGIGVTATATGTIGAGGSITSVSIVNPGAGYSVSNPPKVLAPDPSISYERITNISDVQGFSGIVTGIGTTTGTGANPLAIKFNLNSSDMNGDLAVGYPILIYDTAVGSGVTSIDDSDSNLVGIGTTFADNIYLIQSISIASTSAEIVANVLSTTNIIGLSTVGFSTNPVGKFSWGRLSGFSRSTSPISIGVTGLVVDSGLSTFPTIQRRGYGLRDNGSLRKDLWYL